MQVFALEGVFVEEWHSHRVVAIDHAVVPTSVACDNPAVFKGVVKIRKGTALQFDAFDVPPPPLFLSFNVQYVGMCLLLVFSSY